MKILSTLVLLAFAMFARAQSSADGAIKATVTMLRDGTHKSTVVNPDTHLAEETIEDNKGKVLSRTVYGLDEGNLPRTATFFDGKGKQLNYKAEYQRDGAGRIIGETYTSLTGQPLGRRVYSYGSGNKVTRLDQYDANGNLITPQKPAGPGRPDKKK